MVEKVPAMGFGGSAGGAIGRDCLAFLTSCLVGSSLPRSVASAKCS